MEKVRLIPKIVIFLITTTFFFSCEKESSEELPNEKPTCSIMTPLDIEKVERNQSTMILVDAQDTDGSISKVEFYINNSKKFTANNNPFSFDWNTTGLNAGVYNINIIAFDDRNDTTSTEINVFVPFLDERDGNTYKVTKIGNQIWMAENLNYDPTLNTPNPNPLGRAYKWDEALNACPEGWHLPSDKEWNEMEQFLGMLTEELDLGMPRWRGEEIGIGDKLKSVGFGKNANNSTFFSALTNSSSGWWSSTPDLDGGSYWHINRALREDKHGIWEGATEDSKKEHIRCIKDGN